MMKEKMRVHNTKKQNMSVILKAYYTDNAKKLRGMADKIIFSLGFSHAVDYGEFYSLSNEVFADVLEKYDESQPFESFLYSCLLNKFKTYLTMSNRYKRKTVLRMESRDECGNVVFVEKPVRDDSLDRTIAPFSSNSDDTFITLGDTISDGFDLEKEIIEKDGQVYSDKMRAYLNRLSKLQKNVLQLTADGYSPCEIKKMLHISGRQYSDCNAAIHAYRNVSVLY